MSAESIGGMSEPEPTVTSRKQSVRINLGLAPNPDPNWRDNRVCTRFRPEAFTAESSQSILAGKYACSLCTVRSECADEIMATEVGTRHTTVASLSPGNRKRISDIYFEDGQEAAQLEALTLQDRADDTVWKAVEEGRLDIAAWRQAG